MLTIAGAATDRRMCDRRSRRSFLQIGSLAVGGMTLPKLLQAEALAGKRSQKSVIMIYMPGGPPHQDMYDLKMDAPVDVRGEFTPIHTKVDGIEICELLPRLASCMDRLVPIRSVVGATGEHYSFQCLTGRTHQVQPQGGWPEFGSVVTRLQGPTRPAVPAFVGLSPKMQHRPYNNGKPGFLGPACAPFQPFGEGKDDLVLQGMTLDRLADRRQLVDSVNRLRSNIDTSGLMNGVDAFHQQAFDVLTSRGLAEALDLSKEDPQTLARYGKGTEKHQGDGAPRINEQFLLARRLVEAGVRCVTLSYSFWDWHGQNFRNARENLPTFDAAMSALVEDLHDRGLDKDVTVIAWGEFGRTPKINKDAGRDHWPLVSCALMAGGGMRTGQVIGATNRLGEHATDRPVTFTEILATLYHNLGLDVEHATVTDLSGRPQYLTDHVLPIRELV